MSARALIAGRLYKNPERKVSRAGRPYVAAVVMEGAGDSATWWRIASFNDVISDELVRLSDGDAISVSGTFSAQPYTKGGETRVGFSLVVDKIISARKARRREREDDFVYEGA
jgi:hypothetical protein